MKWLRLILIPIVPIYYLVTFFRNWFYDLGVFKSKAYDLPVICIGNLSTGGTGKTPMVEFLVRLLKEKYKLAVLSRGYKRSTTGFLLANDQLGYKDIGDEPYQLFKKFKSIYVAVDERRTNGVDKLLNLNPVPEVILLDDAYQHRQVRAGFNILLTSYQNLFYKDIVLPTGNLREPRAGYKRADLIVVTKCPVQLNLEEKSRIINSINPASSQEVFFSSIKYSDKVYNSSGEIALKSLIKFTLVTGIANPDPLVSYLHDYGLIFDHLNYPDHHNFTTAELKIIAQKTLIVTTEKDYVRLISSGLFKDNLFYLPIAIEIDRQHDFETALAKATVIKQ